MITPLIAGEVYTLTYTITNRTAGSVVPSCGGVTLTSRSANGTYTETFVAINTNDLAFTPTSTSRFYLDTVSLKRVADGNSYVGNNLSVGTLRVYGESKFTGALNLGYRAITALRTLDATDYTVDCTANSFTVTLPTAIGITGRIYNIKNSGTGTITVATNLASIGGTSTTRFDITKPSASVARYTFDGTGTNPNISAVTIPVGTWLDIQGQNFNAANKGIFQVTASTTNYFEITNAAGIAENDKTLGTGFINFNQRIDDITTQVVDQYENLQVQSTGTNWIVL
jgi:hypothetical protein